MISLFQNNIKTQYFTIIFYQLLPLGLSLNNQQLVSCDWMETWIPLSFRIQKSLSASSPSRVCWTRISPTGVSCIAGRFFTIWATRKACQQACPPVNNSPRHRDAPLVPLGKNNATVKTKRQSILGPCIRRNRISEWIMEADHRVVGGLPKMGDRNDIFNRLYHLEISLYPSCDFTLPSEKVNVNDLVHALDRKVNTGSATKAWRWVSSGPLLHEFPLCNKDTWQKGNTDGLI